MAWQHKDAGITPTNANSAPKLDPFGSIWIHSESTINDNMTVSCN